MPKNLFLFKTQSTMPKKTFEHCTPNSKIKYNAQEKETPTNQDHKNTTQKQNLDQIK